MRGSYNEVKSIAARTDFAASTWLQSCKQIRQHNVAQQSESQQDRPESQVRLQVELAQSAFAFKRGNVMAWSGSVAKAICLVVIRLSDLFSVLFGGVRDLY